MNKKNITFILLLVTTLGILATAQIAAQITSNLGTETTTINEERRDKIPEPPREKPNIPRGKEETKQNKKISNHGDIITTTQKEIWCKWDTEKQRKHCEAIFEIDDYNEEKKDIKKPSITIDFKEQEEITNIQTYYSNDYLYIGETNPKGKETQKGRRTQEEKIIRRPYIQNTPLTKEERQTEEIIPKRIFTNFKPLANTVTIQKIIPENETKLTGKERAEQARNNRGRGGGGPSKQAPETPQYGQNNNPGQGNNQEQNNNNNNNNNNQAQNNNPGQENKGKTANIGITGNVIEGETLSTEKPLAIKVTFEVPITSNNQFNFSLKSEHIRTHIDPEISACAELTTPNTEYTLNQNINTSTSCFSITEENITLNCQGNTITYGHTNGTHHAVWSNRTGTTIQNCNIQQTQKTNNPGAAIYILGTQATIEDTTIHIKSEYTTGIDTTNTQTQIQRTNITIQGKSAYGITLTGSDQSTIQETIIEMRAPNSYATYSDRTKNIQLQNNNIQTNSSSSVALYLLQTNTSKIETNILNSTGDYSETLYVQKSHTNNYTNNKVYADGESSNVLRATTIAQSILTNNSLYAYGIYGAAYFVEGDSSDNTFYNTTVRAHGSDRYGYLSYGGRNNYLQDTNIYVDSDYSYSLLLYNTKHTEIENMQLNTTGVGSAGIFLDFSSTNTTIRNLLSQANNTDTYPLYNWHKGNNFSITNGKLESTAGEPELYLYTNTIEQGGLYNLTNVTYTSEYWHPNVNGELLRSWHLTILTNTSILETIGGVIITAENNNETTIQLGVTGTQGTLTKTLQAYHQTGPTNKTHYNNYTITANYTTTELTNTINITENKHLTFTFDQDPPQISNGRPGTNPGNTPSGGASGEATGTCTPNWECSEWSTCNEGNIERICIDTNECGTATRPTTQIPCEQGKRNTLFDIQLELLEEKASSLEEILIRIFLLNIGIPGEVEANITYTIKSAITGAVVYEETESRPVQTQTEYLKTIVLPILPDGIYQTTANLTYAGQQEPAYSQATLTIATKEKTLLIRNITIGITIAGIVIYMVSSALKRRKKETKRKVYEEEKPRIIEEKERKKTKKRVHKKKYLTHTANKTTKKKKKKTKR